MKLNRLGRRSVAQNFCVRIRAQNLRLLPAAVYLEGSFAAPTKRGAEMAQVAIRIARRGSNHYQTVIIPNPTCIQYLQQCYELQVLYLLNVALSLLFYSPHSIPASIATLLLMLETLTTLPATI